MRMARLSWVILGLAMWSCAALHLPGVSPNEYEHGGVLAIKVNSMSSVKTAIPFDHYTLPFCRPHTIASDVENLGEVLWGDIIRSSPYNATMLVEQRCVELMRFFKRIQQGYCCNMILDNLPLASWDTRRMGYRIGVASSKHHAVLNNHLDFIIQHHRPVGASGHSIVGFYAIAKSIDWSSAPNQCAEGDINAAGLPPINISTGLAEGREVKWTYSVHWQEEPTIEWKTRWDVYWARSGDKKVHWVALVNSLVVLLVLSGIVAFILLRALHKDFNRYNDPENENAAREETGWKLCHADIFRRPPRAALLSVLIGTGCQLLGMSAVTVIFAVLGVISPANRGSLLSVVLFFYAVLGFLAGYTTTRLAKTWVVHSWRNVFTTAMLFPGTCFVLFLGLNCVLWAKSAASSVPFGTLLTLLGMWFGVSMPLVYGGAIWATRLPAIASPCLISEMPREIPELPLLLRPKLTILMAGVVPFGSGMFELYFVLTSLWQHQLYYFGFLAVVALIVVGTVAEVVVVLTYAQLCYEDYRVWWRSFLAGMYYFFSSLQITSFWSGVLYFGYTMFMSYTLFVCSGTIGFCAAFFFVHSIYSRLPKID